MSMDEGHIIIGIGLLRWNRDERTSDRYGSVNLNRSITDCGGIGYDRSAEGKYGVLLTLVVETQPSHHTSDIPHEICPTIPNVGEVTILGVGTLFFEEKEDIVNVGLYPDDCRKTQWLSPTALNYVHDQKVTLIFKQFAERDYTDTIHNKIQSTITCGVKS